LFSPGKLKIRASIPVSVQSLYRLLFFRIFQPKSLECKKTKVAGIALEFCTILPLLADFGYLIPVIVLFLSHQGAKPAPSFAPWRENNLWLDHPDAVLQKSI
jgi:hypothetical protein